MRNDLKKRPQSGKRKRKKKKKSHASIFIIWIFIFIALGSVGYLAMYFFLPSYESQDFHTYFGIDPNEVTIVIKDSRLTNERRAFSSGGEVYFPLSFVTEYIDEYIFWDEALSKATVTALDKVIRIKADELKYYINDAPVETSLPLVTQGGEAFMPSSMIAELYQVEFSYSQRENIAVMDYLTEPKQKRKIAAQTTNVRYKPDKKALIEERLMQDQQVFVYSEEDEYTRIRTENGLLGYVLTRDLGLSETIDAEPLIEPAAAATYTPINGKVNLVWDQMQYKEANTTPERLTPKGGLDVLSPTWFTFDVNSQNGDILSIGDPAYVEWAHSQGYQVWALLSDFSSDRSVLLHQEIIEMALSDTDIRQHVIEQLLSFIAEYNLDGINIDFEYLQKEYADCYLQFFRELYPYMRSRGKALSVDVYNPDMPSYWSQYYNRSEVGKVVDYVCVMAYDENADSAASGPNASFSFVDLGISQTVSEVPSEKVILGLPFFVRVWTEKTVDGVLKCTNEAVDMQTAYSQFASRGAEIRWDDALKCYYSEYITQEDGVDALKRVWLEEAASIEEKLKLVELYDLAGVAGWRRGLETDDVWSLIEEYIP
ncbi:MAG: hypothetical protein LBU32_26255 [Clostridiales bacterium]|jgi:spore germination protein YaaH|nr:hypothetical protein [Clostridiales bacterium]